MNRESHPNVLRHPLRSAKTARGARLPQLRREWLTVAEWQASERLKDLLEEPAKRLTVVGSLRPFAGREMNRPR